MKSLDGLTVTFGITGSIAAYKSAEIIRELKIKGANVRAIMTESAQQFITPLTIESLSGNIVSIDIFDETKPPFNHLELAKSNMLLIAPATANTIAKAANGIADNLLLSTFLAFKGHIVIAPAMNESMYLNQETVNNLEKLRNAGALIVEPEKGDLACGVSGVGRLASSERIILAVENALVKSSDFANKKILVTSGPTREHIDSMRYISNRSSGKMGSYIAQQLKERGADVLMICGPIESYPSGIKTVQIETAQQMKDEVLNKLADFDCLIMAAAVADFTVSNKQGSKIKREDAITLELQPTTDILKEAAARRKKGQVIVGFCATDDNLLDEAKRKLETKNIDLIIANKLSSEGIGPESDFNEVFIVDKKGDSIKIEKAHKQIIAGKILDYLKQQFFS